MFFDKKKLFKTIRSFQVTAKSLIQLQLVIEKLQNLKNSFIITKYQSLALVLNMLGKQKKAFNFYEKIQKVGYL